MKKIESQPRLHLRPKQTSAMRDLRTRLNHLDWLDVVVLLSFILIVIGAFYAQSMRHP
jgi:hypothetical protein